MKNRFFEAPEYIRLDAPLIFFAGPIQGAPDWHASAAEFIQQEDSRIYLASPRRHIAWEGGDFTEAMYNKQVDWETYHLNKAARNGAILFWLAKEKDHVCRRAYAQTSRFELAEWKEKHLHMRGGAGLVVGIENGFTGARYIRRRFEQDCPSVKIFSNLQDVCKEAVKIALRK